LRGSSAIGLQWRPATVRYNFLVMNRLSPALGSLFLLAAVICSPSAATAAQTIPVVDGALGPCSIELTVNTSDGKPVYAATVKVHIAYGVGGFHKLDLEAGSNADGKVKFTGLPARLRRPPLEFEASKDQLLGVLTYDPAMECRAIHPIVLDKPNPPQDK
jgi:hypothetical protein